MSNPKDHTNFVSSKEKRSSCICYVVGIIAKHGDGLKVEELVAQKAQLFMQFFHCVDHAVKYLLIFFDVSASNCRLGILLCMRRWGMNNLPCQVSTP